MLNALLSKKTIESKLINFKKNIIIDSLLLLLLLLLWG